MQFEAVRKALTGFLQYKAAEALSPRTIEIYDDHLNKWIAYAGDPMVSKVKTADVRGYLAWLATEYKPVRFSGNDEPLDPKTIRNIWISLSAFYRWAGGEFAFPNPMLQVAKPKFVVKTVELFTRLKPWGRIWERSRRISIPMDSQPCWLMGMIPMSVLTAAMTKRGS